MYYFRNICQAIRTVAAGLRVTLPYHFARTVVVQYPEVEPTVQGRYRGFHAYQIERCIGCEACAKACPVGCIHVGKSGPRKMDKSRDLAVGGALTEYQIDYNTCLFCGLCTEVCPTACLRMGSLHDSSCYRRQDLVVDFVRLAKEGRRTLLPIWLAKANLPGWAARVRDYWRNLDRDRREWMARADDPRYCGELAQAAVPPPAAPPAASRPQEGAA
ncbi:MAG: NADH-quinone oxidoreductase subunit I [Planctomycetes bacterium]|jgi:NADH-quinone oxidoreductase subunit I|nr:NADH-quinone oxidoreductase subunit I [Planctomycetota bacterium]